jgi:hypothetical protein
MTALPTRDLGRSSPFGGDHTPDFPECEVGPTTIRIALPLKNWASAL